MKCLHRLSLLVLVAMLVGVGFVRADILGAAYAYQAGFSEDFDSMGTTGTNAPGSGGHTYWSVFVNGNQQAESLYVNTWGGVVDGHNAGGTVATDRGLGIYRSAIGEPASLLTAHFQNQTGGNLDALELYFDLEVPWVRYSTSNRVAAIETWYSTDNANWSNMGAGFAGQILNQSHTATTWLSDAEMDAESRALRSLGGVYALPSALSSGADFYVQWRAPGGSLDGNNRTHMLLSIDNITVPVPEPGTLALGMLGAGLLAARRRRAVKG